MIVGVWPPKDIFSGASKLSYNGGEFVNIEPVIRNNMGICERGVEVLKSLVRSGHSGCRALKNLASVRDGQDAREKGLARDLRLERGVLASNVCGWYWNEEGSLCT